MNDLTERNYSRQSPELVNARYSLTKTEGDLVFLLLSAVNKEDEDFKDYVFTLDDLQKKAGVEINATRLKAMAKNIMQNVLEIREDKKSFTLFSWFSYFNYKDGLITCSFDKRLKPYLLELKQYVLADNRQIMQMQSIYSRRIYLMLKERAKFGNRTFDIEELKDTLQTPPSYKAFGQFKEKVLEQAVKDINKFSDLEVSYAPEKKLRKKIISVTFTIKKNHNDLKQFISNIRECYPNQRLYDYKGDTILCSEKGLLYSEQTLKTFDKKTAQIIWELLHENKERLYPFQASLFELQNNLAKISNQN